MSRVLEADISEMRFEEGVVVIPRAPAAGLILTLHNQSLQDGENSLDLSATTSLILESGSLEGDVKSHCSGRLLFHDADGGLLAEIVEFYRVYDEQGPSWAIPGDIERNCKRLSELWNLPLVLREEAKAKSSEFKPTPITPQYRFPKSRSKRLAEALELARKLSGFVEQDDEYGVSPTSEEVSGEDFAGLLAVSQKWKGASFYLGDSSVSKLEFLESLEKAPQSEEVAAEEPAPRVVEQETAPQTEADNEVEITFIKDKPKATEPTKPESTKKRRGCCCCCWWLPFGSAAALAVLLNLL